MCFKNLYKRYNGRSSRIYVNVGTDNINNNNKDNISAIGEMSLRFVLSECLEIRAIH